MPCRMARLRRLDAPDSKFSPAKSPPRLPVIIIKGGVAFAAPEARSIIFSSPDPDQPISNPKFWLPGEYSGPLKTFRERE